MSPTPERGIKRRALVPEPESEAIPADHENTLPVAQTEDLPLSRKTARALDEDEAEGCDQMPQLIALKRKRLEDGTAQVVRHKQKGRSSNVSSEV
jgi:hypothetical protein